MPMIKNYSHFSSEGDKESVRKSPKTSSINYIRQFARVYSTFPGQEFSYFIISN